MRGPHSADVDERATIVSVVGLVAPGTQCRCDFSRWKTEVWVPNHILCGKTRLVSQDIPQGEGGPKTGLRWRSRNVSGKESVCSFFVDDICVVCTPERVADVHAIIQQELFAHARISVHHGKTQVVEPRRCGFASSPQRPEQARTEGCWGLELGTHSMCKSS